MVKFNRPTIRIWGTENPHEAIEYVRDSPKLNVSFPVSSEKGYELFFFGEPALVGITYLDML